MLHPHCQFYCLSFHTDKRANMAQRLQQLGIDCVFSPGIQPDDYRLSNICSSKRKRQWAITYSHLDILLQFISETNKQYAVVCEDDIYIHRDFSQLFKKVFSDFNLMSLDLLLLGYQLPYTLDTIGTFGAYKLKVYMPKAAKYKYHNYPSFLYGTQMYLITRSYALKMLTKYYQEYAGIKDQRFLFDKLLMNTERRAIIYPMLAVENDQQTDPYHRLCHRVHMQDHFI